MNRFPFLAQRLFNVPLLVHPGKAEVILVALAERMGVTQLVRINGDVVIPQQMAFDDDDEFMSASTKREKDKGYDVLNGIAVINIEGTLVQKLGSLRPYSGMMGYDGIRQVLLTAVRDPEVRAIVLLTDSPGGEVAGCFDLADQIFALRGEKPIWAILNESAYSAAYALASAADRIIVPRTGGSGSIGVIAMHVDLSKMLDKDGIKVTFITRGARKADGQPYIPLSDEALSRFQKDIDAVGVLFEETVARNRKISASKVRDMEAATFQGADGVSQGLVDAVMAPDAAFRALLAELG
jgi:signal peptide peptidase SppA